MAELVPIRRTHGRRAADTEPEGPHVWLAIRLTLVVVGVAAALFLVYAVSSLVIALIFSVLFAYLVAPLVAVVRRRLRVPEGAAIGIAYCAVFGAIALAVTLFAPYVADAVKRAPDQLQAAASHPLSVLSRWLHLPGASASMIDRAVTTATGGIESAFERIGAMLMHAASYLPWLVMIPILAFFLLYDARELQRSAIGALPERWQADAPELLDRIDRALAAYIRAQLAACAIVGAIVGLGLVALGVPFAGLLGLAAGIAEFVPMVGPLAIALVAAGVAGVHAPLTAVWVLVFLGVLRVLQDYVIYPRLIGSGVHLHPFAVILAVLAGAEIGGVVGVLLSVPALAVGSAVYHWKRGD
jgi:predicted PurR-regulated permease PerM